MFSCRLEVTLFLLDSFLASCYFLLLACTAPIMTANYWPNVTFPPDSFIVWWQVEGGIKKLNLLRNLALAQPSGKWCHWCCHSEIGITENGIVYESEMPGWMSEWWVLCSHCPHYCWAESVEESHEITLREFLYHPLAWFHFILYKVKNSYWCLMSS